MAEVDKAAVGETSDEREEGQPGPEAGAKEAGAAGKLKTRTRGQGASKKVKKLDEIEWPKKSFFETHCFIDGESAGKMVVRANI